MANLDVAILLLGLFAISAVRRQAVMSTWKGPAILLDRAGAGNESGVGNGPCPHKKDAWVVFQELTTLNSVFNVGEHTELLFCYLTHDKRERLGLPADGAGDHFLVERTVWERDPHLCYGVSYGSGIDIYEKRLSEERMAGAPGKCHHTKKYFKGCIGEWQTALVEEVARLPSEDDNGWWLLPMIHAFKTCQPNWKADDYIPFALGGVAHNCNGFAQTLLDCSLQLGTDLHLNSPKLSNTGFQHTCACAEKIDETGQHKSLWIDRRVEHFAPCEMFPTQHAPNQTLVQKDAPGGCYDARVVSDHPSQPILESVLGATDPLIMESLYRSGCYCEEREEEEALVNCRCKVACDKRPDCGIKVEQSRCTWCCESDHGAYWAGEYLFDGRNLSNDVSPIGQKDTCRAPHRRRRFKPGNEKMSLYDALSTYEVPIAESAELCQARPSHSHEDVVTFPNRQYFDANASHHQYESEASFDSSELGVFYESGASFDSEQGYELR